MGDSKIINFNQKREQLVEEKRRAFERVLFRNLVGCYTVLDKNGTLYPISLVDISLEGCLFKIPQSKNGDSKYRKGTTHQLRIYFTEGSYIPVSVEVAHSRVERESDGTRASYHGCKFDKTTASYDVLESFINFIYSFAEYSTIDKGDNKVFFL